MEEGDLVSFICVTIYIYIYIFLQVSLQGTRQRRSVSTQPNGESSLTQPWTRRTRNRSEDRGVISKPPTAECGTLLQEIGAQLEPGIRA